MKIYSYNSPFINKNIGKTLFNRQKCLDDTQNRDRVAFCGGVESIMRVKSNAVWDKDLAQKFVEVFKNPSQNTPKGLILKVSKDDKSVLEGFKKKLENGIVLEVCKNTYKRLRGDLTYISVKEFQDGRLRDSFGIDYYTNDLVGLNRSGELALLYNDYIKISLNNPKHSCYCNMLNQYSDLVFNHQDKEEESIIESEPVPVVEEETEDIAEEEEENMEAAITPKNIRKIRNISADDEGKLLLSDEIQSKIEKINKNIIDLSQFMAGKRGYCSDFIKLKMSYEPIIYIDGKQKRTIFKYGKNENLSVLHIPSNDRFTRIIHTDKHGNETHYLIDSCQKIVSNLNKKNPWLMPEKFRYMTAEEIGATDIETYIEFLQDATDKYNDYIYKGISSIIESRRERKINPDEELDKFKLKMKNCIAESTAQINESINRQKMYYALRRAPEHIFNTVEEYEKYLLKEFGELQNRAEKYLENLIEKNKDSN